LPLREASKKIDEGVYTVGKMLKIKMVKSVITRPEKQRKIIRGLGLKKLNSTVTLVDTPEIRGMINKVIHLVSVEESKEKSRPW
jgi:large subunit ribosomal protein L30